MSDGLLTDGELSGGAICGWIKITTGGWISSTKTGFSLFSISLCWLLSSDLARDASIKKKPVIAALDSIGKTRWMFTSPLVVGDAICCGDGCIETEREQQRTLRSSHAFLLALSATGCRDVNPRAADLWFKTEFSDTAIEKRLRHLGFAASLVPGE